MNQEIESFIADFKKKTMGSISTLNGDSWQSKAWDHKGPAPSDPEKTAYTYRHEVNASRGKVFEKATVSEIFIDWPKAAKTLIQNNLAKEGDKVSVRVLQVEIFPYSALLPMGHFNIERFYAGSNMLIANMDVFPASTPKDDVDSLRSRMAEVAKKHGMDQWELSSGLAQQYNMDGWDYPLAARAGFQFKMLPLEKNFPAVKDGAGVFFKGYLDMVMKLKDLPYNADDEKLMNEMRCHWLEYSLLKDGAVRMAREKGHPFDALRWMGMPPTIHY